MEDTDAEGHRNTPFEGASPAVRRVGEGTGDGNAPPTARDADGSPFEAELTPAVRPVGDDGTTAGTAGPGEVPDIEALVGPRRTLEPGIQGVWTLQSAVSALILGVVSAVALAFLPFGEAWMGSAVFTAVFVLGVAVAVLRYRAWCYEVREDSLYLEYGVVTKVTTVVPYVRIQHVDTRRGPIERVFGLATTVVYTAGSRGADVSVPGLTPGRADDLQARLKQLAIAAEGEDAV